MIIQPLVEMLDRSNLNMPSPEAYTVASGIIAVYSASCPGREDTNEDAAAIIPMPSQESAAVLVVADGMGGARGGSQASRLAISTLVNTITQAGPDELDIRNAILDGIEGAGKAVADLGIGAATTIAVVEINGRTIRPYHVGDSMILVTGQRGRNKLRTVSHSPVAFAVEAGVLDESDAMHHEDRHVVSNAVGMPDMRIDLGPSVNLAHRDTLIIASDGLFDNLHMDEIVNLIRTGPIDRAAKKLVDIARSRMTNPTADQPSKPDDLTFIIYRPHAGR